MDIHALQLSLRQFAAERDWQPFHTPKNLATALMVEAAELAEIFQWMTPEQSKAAHTDRVLQERIGDEVADVLLYLLQVADHAEIDMKRAVGRKLLKNARKHPPLRPGLPAGPLATAPAQTHVLIDWENVQPGEADIRALVPDVTDVWVFHGPHQKGMETHHTSFGDRTTRVPIARTGKNSLDFHLAFYMGYIASRHPDARFVVLANDQGYGPMVDHAIALGFSARQTGFGAPSPRKQAFGKSETPAPVVKIESPALEKALSHVQASLRKTSSRPGKERSLATTIQSLLGSGADSEHVAAVLSGLLASGTVAIDEAGRVHYDFG